MTISTPIPADVTRLFDFTSVLDKELPANPEQAPAMQQDFHAGIASLLQQGFSLSAVLEAVNPQRLHGFYANPPTRWYPLDGGAKQYPVMMRKGQMPIFRITATLYASVNPSLLQLALTFVLPAFPHFATRLQRGLFWYYLKPCMAHCALAPWTACACQPIDMADGTASLFRVMCSGTHIAIEVFHVLTDGMGGTLFLTALLTEYHRLLGNSMPETPYLPTTDWFKQLPRISGGKPLIQHIAIQLPTTPLPKGTHATDWCHLSAANLQAVARKHGVSVTALMTTVVLTACRAIAPKRTGCYRVQVPMNLRTLLGKQTLRNFSWFGVVSLSARSLLSGDALLCEVNTQLRKATDPIVVGQDITVAQRTLRCMQWVPLSLKEGILRTIYQMTGDCFFTTTLSNMGKVRLPDALACHVAGWTVQLGPSITNPTNMALTTWGDDAVLSCTRTTSDRRFEDALRLAAQSFGIPTRWEYEEVSCPND